MIAYYIFLTYAGTSLSFAESFITVCLFMGLVNILSFIIVFSEYLRLF